MDVWVDEWMEGWMNVFRNGQMDGWMEMFYLKTHSAHFIHGNMASDTW